MGVTTASSVLEPDKDTIPPLENGDHLEQPEFHARYEAMPECVKAELIGGIVYMASPVKRRHGGPQSMVQGWLELYAEHTPGTDVFDNTTTILGNVSQPQPDSCLIVRPEFGGQVQITADDYLRGPPELVVEVSNATHSIDLGVKMRDYERAGVREYVVAAVFHRQVFWHLLRASLYQPLVADSDGIIRSPGFPGLWLDPAALLAGDRPRHYAVLRQGLASPEHVAFVAKLAAAAPKTP